MAELFTLTLGRDWLIIQQHLHPVVEMASMLQENTWRKMRICPSSSDDMDTLLLDNATIPTRTEGSIVKLESVKC